MCSRLPDQTGADSEPADGTAQPGRRTFVQRAGSHFVPSLSSLSVCLWVAQVLHGKTLLLVAELQDSDALVASDDSIDSNDPAGVPDDSDASTADIDGRCDGAEPRERWKGSHLLNRPNISSYAVGFPKQAWLCVCGAFRLRAVCGREDTHAPTYQGAGRCMPTQDILCVGVVHCAAGRRGCAAHADGAAIARSAAVPVVQEWRPGQSFGGGAVPLSTVVSQGVAGAFFFPRPMLAFCLNRTSN